MLYFLKVFDDFSEYVFFCVNKLQNQKKIEVLENMPFAIKCWRTWKSMEIDGKSLEIIQKSLEIH